MVFMITMTGETRKAELVATKIKYENSKRVPLESRNVYQGSYVSMVCFEVLLLPFVLL